LEPPVEPVKAEAKRVGESVRAGRRVRRPPERPASHSEQGESTRRGVLHVLLRQEATLPRLRIHKTRETGTGA